MNEREGFFRPGGTLPSGAASYVPRRADDEIVEALVAGVYVFVLDSRQKGKSSLIVRSLDRLHEHGVTTVRIDLQRLGSNLTPEQWYAGLLRSLGQDMGLVGALFDHWRASIEIGPATRFFSALEEVVLPAVPGPIVVFVDEVDYVRSLPFSADEFFAAIRECFNRRSLNPEFGRLTFCLVGVAAPSQLIENNDVTPFNIGRRVELTDFTRDETRPYEDRLSTHGRDGGRLLDRIHHWVAGHPYLTQLIASRVAEDSGAHRAESVDAIVAEALLAEDVRHKEPNLADVERRLLEAALPGLSPDESRSQVLEVYGEMLRNDLPPGRHDALLIATLLLSGVAKEEQGRIRIRNRLYRTLFNERWRKANLPDAEARRQRAASVRAAWKVGTVGTLILASFATLVVWLFVLAKQRDVALAESQRLQAFSERQAYESSIALASEQIADGGYLAAARIVDGQAHYARRGWEWHYLSAVLGRSRVVRPPPEDPSNQPVVAWREGTALVECRRQGVYVDGHVVDPDLALNGPLGAYRLTLRNGEGETPIEVRVARTKALLALGAAVSAFSGDRSVEARATAGEWSIEILDHRTSARTTLRTETPVRFLRVSPTGRFVAITASDGSHQVFDRLRRVWSKGYWAEFNRDDTLLGCTFATGREPEVRRADGSLAHRLDGHLGAVTSLAWFSDGRRLLTSGMDGTLRIWDAVTGRQLRLLSGARSSLLGATLSKDEKSALACSSEGSILELDLDARSPVSVVNASAKEILAGRIAPDGETYVTVGTEGRSCLLDVRTGRIRASLDIGFEIAANPLVFSADGSWFACATATGSLAIVEARTGRELRRLTFGGHKVTALRRDGSGRIVIALGAGGIACLDRRNGDPYVRSGVEAQTAAVSPDGSHIAIASEKGVVTLLDGRSLATIRPLYDGKTLVRHLEFSHKGRWLAVATASSLTVLCELANPANSRILSGHASRVWGASFSADDRRLLTNSFDGTARVWDVATTREVACMQHPGWVSTAEWSPDEERVVTSCADGNVRVFEATDGRELLKLPGHEGFVFSAEFTPDGTTVVSSGSDGTVRFWRTAMSPIAQSGDSPR